MSDESKTVPFPNNAFITSTVEGSPIAEERKFYVKINFRTIEEMQSWYRELMEAKP